MKLKEKQSMIVWKMYTGIFYKDSEPVFFGARWDSFASALIHFSFRIKLYTLVKYHSKIPKYQNYTNLDEMRLTKKLKQKRIIYTDQVSIDKKVQYFSIGKK